MGLGSPAVAGEIIVATDRGGERWWADFAQGLAEQAGQPVRLGDHDPWPGSPTPSDTHAAKKSFDQGLEHFLALQLGKAATRFDDAFGRYQATLDVFPFDRDLYESTIKAGFYAAWSYLQNRKKRLGRERLRDILTRFPDAKPDAQLFPPPFRSEVEDARRKLQRRSKFAEVEVTVRPADALISVDGRVYQGGEGIHTVTVASGRKRIGAALPGLAVAWTEVDADATPRVQIDLTAWPKATPRPLSGNPVSAATVNAFKVRGGASYLVWITSGERVSRDDSVVWVHDLDSAAVTAVLIIPRGAGPDAGSVAAAAVALALETDDMEVLVIEKSGPRRDSALSTRVEAVIRDQAVSGEVPLEPIVPEEPGDSRSSVRLGVALATGFGVATEVTDPGLAPTPLVGRLNLSWRATPSVDVGLGGRFQVINPAILGEAFVRLRFPWVYLRTGVGVGTITHKILETENRKESTSELVGPAVGLEIPIGPVEIALNVHAPLFPNVTVHADLGVGLGLDF